MAITDKSERQLQELVSALPPDIEDDYVTVDLDTGQESVDVEVVELPDGSAIVDLGMESETGPLLPQEHEANLANVIDDRTLSEMAQEIIRDVNEDLMSRREWEHTLKESLKQLGFKMEQKSEPWQGACSVIHPLLSEAVVRFQSQTIGDILPPSGPVKGSVVGLETPKKIDQAHRVARHMNYVLMDEMKEYRPETEKLLFGVGLNGAAFRKIFKDPVTGRPKSLYIEAQNLIVHNEATDLESAARITHRMFLYPHEVERYVDSGFYRDVNLQDPFSVTDEIQTEIDQLTGVDTQRPQQDKREIYETQCYMDLGEGAFSLPYIVSVDVTNQTVLAIYRNWDPDDPLKLRIPHIVHYDFIPGLGFYGFGYAHLIGNTAKGVTSVLQQLVDAGTLSNVPGGLKAKGARMENDSGPVMPGEWRDVEVLSGTLKDSFMPIPTKEPSATLFQLMQGMVQDGRRLASMADLKISDMNQEAPVGTTLAILERAMKMQTAVQQRIHAGLKNEFKILARIIGDNDPRYPYEVEEGEEIAAEDYSDEVDVIPVSDPNASTLAHRVMQYQAALTAAQQTPQVYDMAYLNRQFVEAIGMQNADKIVPQEGDLPWLDPISENAEILQLGRVGVKEGQDHQSHIRVHMALRGDPEIQQMVQNSPMGGQVMAALDAHIRTHMGYLMREQMEEAMGTTLPELGKEMPADVEQRIARLAADAADQVIGRKQAMQQAEQNAAMQQDPVIQMKMQELQIRAQEVQGRIQQAQMDAQQKAQAEMLKQMLEAQKFRADMDMEQQKLALDRQEMILDQLTKLAQMEQGQALEGARLGVQVAQSVAQSAERSAPQTGGQRGEGP